MKGKEIKRRNCLIESARITRGCVSDVKHLRTSDYAALFLPGGLGAIKNISDFFFFRNKCSVSWPVGNIIREFKSVKR